jgi:hypothetical protein
MDERPMAPPPSQDSTPPKAIDPVMEGITFGIQAALVLVGVYVVGLLLFIIATEWRTFDFEDIRDFGAVAAEVVDFYMGSAMVIGLALVLGGVPALFVGFLGGAFIGWTFRFINKRLPFQQALLYGFGISLLLLGVRLGGAALFRGLEQVNDDLTDTFMWLAWFAPNLIAFFGFWWVAYQLNEQMPVPLEK